MQRKLIVLFFSALLLTALLSGCGAGAGEEPEADSPFSVDLLSTGKSDCALLRMDGMVILCDTADADDYAGIAALLQQLGVERIDYMVLSHYDKDHIGGAAELIRNFQVVTVLRPDYREGSEEYYALMDAISARDTESVTLTEDYTVSTEYGSIAVDPADEDYGDDNNNSLVMTVTYRDHRLLFLGDAKKQRMKEFVSVAAESYDFIKLPHHGDSNKPLLQLLRDTRPLWTAETVEARALVDPELLETLEELEIPLYCTCDGSVHIWWDGEELRAEQK